MPPLLKPMAPPPKESRTCSRLEYNLNVRHHQLRGRGGHTLHVVLYDCYRMCPVDKNTRITFVYSVNVVAVVREQGLGAQAKTSFPCLAARLLSCSAIDLRDSICNWSLAVVVITFSSDINLLVVVVRGVLTRRLGDVSSDRSDVKRCIYGTNFNSAVRISSTASNAAWARRAESLCPSYLPLIVTVIVLSNDTTSWSSYSEADEAPGRC